MSEVLEYALGIKMGQWCTNLFNGLIKRMIKSGASIPHGQIRKYI